ncbi:MAG: LacI family DNA-binding transcriptional regulator [Melioribacteraceae bacterium]|nr:LacI family DNA-binding transcriptional regulator [Melioribacteraceae bacterium]
MNPTIKDVAKHAGVSTATVSLVIHDNSRISPETKRKVLKSIKTLHYLPSKSARDLVTQRAGNIGFIITDDHFLRTEPFYTRIFLGAEFEARDGDYYVLLATVESNFNEEDQLPRFIQERNVDGIIIAGKVPQNLIDRILELKIPLAFVDYETTNNCCPNILIDNIQGGILATSHLIGLGHKQIGFVGADIQHPSLLKRFTGYKQALENAKIGFNDKFVETGSLYPDRQNGYDAAKKLIEKNKNLTSIFACNDAMAIGVMHYLKDNGFKIPDDFSIIGFDDVESDLLLDPPLSTIRVPKIELGAESIRIITSYLKTKTIPKKILVPVELIIRQSTSAPGSKRI